MKSIFSLQLLHLADRVQMSTNRQRPKLIKEIEALIPPLRDHIESLNLDESSLAYRRWDKVINEIHAARELLEDEKNPEEAALALRSAESYL